MQIPQTKILIQILFILIIGIVQDVSMQQPTPAQQQQIARLIKIPLIRSITPGQASSQPVISYYAPVHMGTPAKTFNIQFDVGYSDLFVPHYTWNPFKVNLHYGTGFLCKESSTCVKTDRTYTSDCQNCRITGKPYEDVVSFSSAYRTSAVANHSMMSRFSAPVELPVSFRQNFLAASDASDARFRYLPVDGFFGLGPDSQSSAGSLQNPIVSLHKAGLIDNLQFAFWFNPVLDSNQGGELVLGGVDTVRYQGQIFWHPLAGMDGHWTLNLQQVTLGGQLFGCTYSRCTATISSSINEVYGPKDQVKRLYDLLSTVPSADGGLPLIDCRRISQLPTLTFNVDGIPYVLLPSNYIRKTTDQSTFKSETCYVAVLPLESQSNQWILGTNFLGAYYSIFDLTHRQVGFASLR